MAKGKESNFKGIFEKLVPVLLLATIALSFFVGTLWQKVQNLEKGTVSGTTTTTTTTQQAAAQPAAKVDLSAIKGVFDKDVIKIGDASRKILFIEIGDPSCPYCHIAGGHDPELNNQVGSQFKLVSEGGTYVAPVPEMKKLVDQGKASFAYIYFPGHGNGEMAMKALYCADEKGKFWEAHDLLMSNAGYNLQNTDVKNDKSQSGKVADFLKGVVDPTFLKECLDSGKYDQRLQDDVVLARQLGVQGTPGFFVNETTYPGAYSFKDMQATVDSILK